MCRTGLPLSPSVAPAFRTNPASLLSTDTYSTQPKRCRRPSTRLNLVSHNCKPQKYAGMKTITDVTRMVKRLFEAWENISLIDNCQPIASSFPIPASRMALAGAHYSVVAMLRRWHQSYYVPGPVRLWAPIDGCQFFDLLESFGSYLCHYAALKR